MNRLLTALLALAFASLAQAADEPSVAASAATKTGEAIKHGAAKTGEVVGTTVERTEAGVEKGAKKVGKAVKHGAEKTGEVLETTAERTKEGVKKGAKKVKSAVTPASAAASSSK